MVTQTFEITAFQGYIENLPKKLQKASTEINMEMAKSLQMGIRMRAPGSLKITQIQATGNNTLNLIGYLNWSYVDMGFVPNHKIPIQAFELNKSEPGMTAGQKLKQFIPKEDITGWVRPKPSSSKGFVSKSIVSMEQRVPEIIERGLNKAFQK